MTTELPKTAKGFLESISCLMQVGIASWRPNKRTKWICHIDGVTTYRSFSNPKKLKRFIFENNLRQLGKKVLG